MIELWSVVQNKTMIHNFTSQIFVKYLPRQHKLRHLICKSKHKFRKPKTSNDVDRHLPSIYGYENINHVS